MKSFDYWLQCQRINQAARFIRKEDKVLDIGSYDGVLFEQLKDLQLSGVGIDPLAQNENKGSYRLVKGLFPDAFHANEKFNCITLLAVLEHIPKDAQQTLAQNCFDYLMPQGRVIITVPSSLVDYILVVLRFFRIIDGMSLEEHYGFKTSQTLHIFSVPKFRLLKHATFQFGLNHLFVFEKVS